MISVLNTVSWFDYWCFKWLINFLDIIIVEDDPYYFLQAGTYHPKAERSSTVIQGGDEDATFIASLAPSFLKWVINYRFSSIM